MLNFLRSLNRNGKEKFLTGVYKCPSPQLPRLRVLFNFQLQKQPSQLPLRPWPPFTRRGRWGALGRAGVLSTVPGSLSVALAPLKPSGTQMIFVFNGVMIPLKEHVPLQSDSGCDGRTLSNLTLEICKKIHHFLERMKRTGH